MNEDKDQLKKSSAEKEKRNLKIRTIIDLSDAVIRILTAVASVYIAFSANMIYNAQKEIAEKNARPVIDVATEYDYETNATKVSVVNTGGLLNELEYEILPYLIVVSLHPESDGLLLGAPFKVSYLPLAVKTGPSGMYYNGVPVKLRVTTPHSKFGSLLEITDDSTQMLIAYNMLDSLYTEYDILYTWIEGESTYIMPKEGAHLSNNNTLYSIRMLLFNYYLRLSYTDMVDGSRVSELYSIHPGHIPTDKDFILKGLNKWDNSKSTFRVHRIRENSDEEKRYNKVKELLDKNGYKYGIMYLKRIESDNNSSIDEEAVSEWVNIINDDEYTMLEGTDFSVVPTF